MNIMYLLIGLSITLAGIFLWSFIWAVRDDQYKDDYTPSVRILFDNNGEKESKNKKNKV